MRTGSTSSIWYVWSLTVDCSAIVNSFFNLFYVYLQPKISKLYENNVKEHLMFLLSVIY